jgi:hypothetical protein
MLQIADRPSFCLPILNLRSFRSDGPHFDGLAVVEGGAAFGYLHRLLDTAYLNDKEPCDRFLGFCERSVRYRVSVRDNFIVML